MKGLLGLHQEHAVEWHHLLRGESIPPREMNRMTIDFIFAFGMGLGKKRDDENEKCVCLSYLDLMTPMLDEMADS